MTIRVYLWNTDGINGAISSQKFSTIEVYLTKNQEYDTHLAQLVHRVLLLVLVRVTVGCSAAHLLVEGSFAVLHHTLHHSPHTPHIRSTLGLPCRRPQQGFATKKPPQFGLMISLISKVGIHCTTRHINITLRRNQGCIPPFNVWRRLPWLLLPTSLLLTADCCHVRLSRYFTSFLG